MKARIWIAQGKLAEAADWARERGVSATDDASYLSEFDHLTLVRLLLAQHRAHQDTGALDQAAGLLDRLLRGRRDLRTRRKSPRDPHAAGPGPRRAGTSAAGPGVPGPSLWRRRPNPRRTSGSSWTRARPWWGCCATPSTRASPATTRVACSASAHRPKPGPRTRGSARPRRRQSPLSERELQVLRLLDSELSGPQIARELFVSHNTVRTHTKHIFTKLDVTSRRAAVCRARERGLI